MTTGETDVRNGTRGPWHRWPVAGFFVALYLGGLYDYVMCLTTDAGFFRERGYGAAQVAYFTDYPPVPRLFWTVGIGCGLVAGLLLAARSRWAGPVAATSVVSTVCLDVLTFGFRDRWSVMGRGYSTLDLLFLALTAGLALYCRSLAARGLLR